MIQAWIDQGAEWPDELSGDRSSTPADAVVEKMRTALREGKSSRIPTSGQGESQSQSNAKGQDGWTPLMYAALYGNVESCKLLLDRGAAVNARNDAGGTALMYAVDDVAKTKLLLERGADPNLRSGEGRTALMIAVANSGSFPVVKLLLEKGADAKLSLPDGRGRIGAGSDLVGSTSAATSAGPRSHSAAPAFGCAVDARCQECFELMLPHAQPRDLNAALRAATITGNCRLIDMLLERGAQAPPRDTAGGSALSDADSSRHDPDISEPRGRSEPEDILRTDDSRFRQASGQ